MSLNVRESSSEVIEADTAGQPAFRACIWRRCTSLRPCKIELMVTKQSILLCRAAAIKRGTNMLGIVPFRH